MALRGKVDDDVRLLLGKQPENKVPVCNVSLDKLVVRPVLNGFQGFQIACVGKGIQIDDGVIRVFVNHIVHKIAADETGSACDDEFHNVFSFLLHGGSLILREVLVTCRSFSVCRCICRPEHP